jgi:conjugative transposon TraM protein
MTKKNNNNTVEEKKEPTLQEIQRKKKMLVYPLFFLLFAGFMWLIFAPSSKDKEEQKAGFNADIPMPKEEGIILDKQSAYEQEAMKQKEEEKMKNLQDFAFLLGENDNFGKREEKISLDLGDEQPASTQKNTSAIESSVNAYKSINRQLAWYDEPAVEIDEQSQLEVQWRIQELERKQKESEDRRRIEDEQLRMIEKTYQMAAKYMPGTTGAQSATEVSQTTMGASASKAATQPVRQVKRSVVSRLSAEMDDETFIETYKEPRNLGFLTAASDAAPTDKNTIYACVHKTTTLTNGKELQIRLLEPMQAGDVIIPENTIITGICRISSDRLEITVGSILHASRIIPVGLEAYDLDGVRGVFVPNSAELNALNDVTASLATTAGTSIMISNNAGSQLAADVGKGLIQGTSQYINKKLTTVKVTLKAGHNLLLLSKNQ